MECLVKIALKSHGSLEFQICKSVRTLSITLALLDLHNFLSTGLVGTQELLSK